MDFEAGGGRLMAYDTKPGLMVETQKSGGCCQSSGVVAHLKDGDQKVCYGGKAGNLLRQVCVTGVCVTSVQVPRTRVRLSQRNSAGKINLGLGSCL